MNAAARTAIGRRIPSAPARWLVQNGYVPAPKGWLSNTRGVKVLDYGCGRGKDCETFGWHGWDPFHRPDAEVKLQAFDYVVCNYVLNVVSEAEERSIIREIRTLLRPGGRAYFAVRRDKPETWAPIQRWSDPSAQGLQSIRCANDFEIFELTG